MTHKYERKIRLWKREAQSDRHPDWSGDIVLDGVAYWLSGWTQDDGSVRAEVGKAKVDKPVMDTAQRGNSYAEASGAGPDLDDEIPF